LFLLAWLLSHWEAVMLMDQLARCLARKRGPQAQVRIRKSLFTAIDDRLANTRFGLLCKSVLSRVELWILRYYKRGPMERNGIESVRQIYRRESSLISMIARHAMPVLFSPPELFNLWAQAQTMRKHGGAFAEVGAYRGDSAEVTCMAKGDRTFYIFEAFEGLPHVNEIDSRFRAGLFASVERDLRRRLECYPNTVVIGGYFPNSAAPVVDEKFSYVHLDVDLYEGTYQALDFFYPRMLPGGRFIGHDYGQCRGVWQAFNEFFEGKPEALEPLCTSQVVVIKA
jgi:O-methyltransferase